MASDDTTTIRPARWLEYLPVDELVPDPRNPKAHADDDLDASIERFDFTEPVMIDERTGMLVAGHGRREAVMRWRDAGKPPPDGVMFDDLGRWLLPVLRGWSSRDDDHAGAYLVAANRLTEKGGWTQDALAVLLTDLRESSTLDGTGFTSDDLDDLLSTLTPPDFQPVPPDEQPKLDIKAMVTCPHCGHEFQRN